MQDLLSSDIWRLLSLSPPGWGMTLLQGLAQTLKIAVGGFGLGLCVGVIGALCKLYGGLFVRDLVECYTTLVRAVPELVLILLLYYAGTDLLNRMMLSLGLGEVSVDAFVAGVAVIAFVQGAYSTEVIRGAIQAIERGQIETALAFGMTPLKTFCRVILPLMLPNALPGLSNLWLVATKDTALLAVMGFGELTLAANQAAGATKSYFLFFAVAGLLYLLVAGISYLGFAALERHARRGIRPTA